MREEARDFRLISTALSAESRVRTRAEEEEKLSQGSVETIHQQLFDTLDLLQRRSAADLRAAVARRVRRAPQGQGAGARDSPHIAEGASLPAPACWAPS